MPFAETVLPQVPVKENKVGLEDLSVAGNDELQPKDVFRIRSYQLEMLEESMRRNIIVAMDTGSGKTLMYAILRIQAELERCPPEKLCWVLCPTVELAFQQYNVVLKHLPAFQARLLSGADNVEYWTKQWIWDDVLKDMRVVVSTHQVLLDALGHAFVEIQRIALMVFDEAHSCINNHPSSRILQDFYHTATESERPAVLGLTASPVVNSKVGSLQALETNLNAIARTPKLHREELLLHVHPPKLIKLMCPSGIPWLHSSLALTSLREVYLALDIEQDPWIKKMRSDPITRNSAALNKALRSGKTYSHDQIKDLHGKALAVHNELGPSAADYYLEQCIRKFQKGVAEGSVTIEMFENEEKAYLRSKLGEVEFPCREESLLANCPYLSPKVQTLIEFLKKEESPDFSGLVFVQTRAQVAVLSHILIEYISSFEISTFVGASSFAGRKGAISELADVKNQKTTLDDLRRGKKNLIVTTNALEEGIDVSRCKLVVCFERPHNLKSFIQRRGRARKSDSKYVIMFEEDELELVKIWTALEAEMKEVYMDDLRLLNEIQEQETLEEDASDSRPILNKSTGARVTINDAVQHLYHFCATLPAAPYVDRSPVFSFEDHSVDPKKRVISATVMLPNSVDPSVRQASGTSLWRTEKIAKRDAALECYRALHAAGLIDEHLLPLGHVDEAVDEAYSAVEKRPSLVEVSPQIDPWRYVAAQWQTSTMTYPFVVKIEGMDTVCSEMLLLLPVDLPVVEDFDLHWNTNTTSKVIVGDGGSCIENMAIAPAAKATSLLLKSVFRGRVDAREDFTALFVPCNIADLTTWVQDNKGTIKATNLSECDAGNDMGVIRDLSHNGVPYIFTDVTYALEEEVQGVCMDIDHDKTMAGSNLMNMSVAGAGRDDMHQVITDSYANRNGAETNGMVRSNATSRERNDLGNEGSNGVATLLEVTKFPKKIDFLHSTPGQDVRAVSDSKPRTLLARDCEMDRLPLRYSKFALFIPSILHKIQVAMVVDQLCEGLLSQVQFDNRDLVTTAICASSAHEGTDYQRLEFFGDSMLKYMTSLTLMAGHVNWHEGILSHMKDHIVSNSSLASAALKTGVDKFILTKSFTGRKWRPMHNSTILKTQPERKRDMSSKTLADVVEALIGAAYLDGGPPKALTCLSIFLPSVPWLSPSSACHTLSTTYANSTLSSPHLTLTSSLISHPFTSPSLLTEALTHPSHHGPHSSSSYQRLEYLGDAILDNIVTHTTYTHTPPIPTPQLHLIRTALVNGHFLAFLCLQHSTPLPRTDPITANPHNITTVSTSRAFHLWQSMRHASPTVAQAQQECVSRYSSLHPTISALLAHGTHYPWSALVRLDPPKHMSDIVESLLGAIYIDTRGDLSACEAFLERIGLMKYLRRVMDGGVALLHPKEEVGMLADREAVRYEIGRDGEEEGAKRLTCRVLVGGREVVSVGGGLSAVEVQTRAAEEACRVLRGKVGSVQRGRVDGGVDLEDGTESGDVEEMEQDVVIDGEGGESDGDVYMTADE